MFFEKRISFFFLTGSKSLQNHFKHSSVGRWPLVSGGGNTSDTFCILQ
jgi:hypothetical protein